MALFGPGKRGRDRLISVLAVVFILACGYILFFSSPRNFDDPGHEGTKFFGFLNLR
jgi:hypothetical protein